MGINYNNEKISTDITGLDRLLFGGIQLQEMHSCKSNEPTSCEKELSVVIYGDNGTSKALFAMQLLHGLTKHLLKLPVISDNNGIMLGSPVFYSPKKYASNLSDMLLDTLISKCVNRIIEDNVKNEKKWCGCKFSSAIFDVKSNDKILQLECSKLDQYIGEEVVIYNNRTNALHLTVAHHPSCIKSSNDSSNLIARRYSNQIGEYSKSQLVKDLGELKDEFFDISIYAKDNQLEKKHQEPLGSVYFPCVVIDGYINDDDRDWVERLRKKTLVTIYVVDTEAESEKLNPDLLIEMRCHEDKVNRYMTYQLCIRKSVLQSTALGWHQYKKRDYGIEIYPSTHVTLQRRRHMPKALLRGYSDILSDTFQQYVDQNYFGRNENVATAYSDYIRDKDNNHWKRLKRIYQTLQEDLHASGVLKEILIEPQFVETEEKEEEPRGRVTAIIGESNTYKRYLSLGSTFSVACRKEHTLNVLLDQEYYTMRKRVVCPTWAFRSFFNRISCKADKLTDCRTCNKCKLPNCHSCYSYIHFWDLRMGYITPDEFFYYLIRQINIFFEKEPNGVNRLKRIVIDDIQKIDYSFPLLQGDKLFLTTLISICKDYEIDLFILCDKKASLVHELRSMADNVICAERKDKECRLYIERFGGYNAPSHIFGCRIENIEELFYCTIEEKRKLFHLNENRIDNIFVPNMDHFWVSNDTNKISNTLDNLKL